MRYVGVPPFPGRRCPTLSPGTDAKVLRILLTALCGGDYAYPCAEDHRAHLQLGQDGVHGSQDRGTRAGGGAQVRQGYQQARVPGAVQGAYGRPTDSTHGCSVLSTRCGTEPLFPCPPFPGLQDSEHGWLVRRQILSASRVSRGPTGTSLSTGRVVFPGLIYRMQMPKIVLLIFVSGKIVLGGKNRDDIYKAFENITRCSQSSGSFQTRTRRTCWRSSPPPLRRAPQRCRHRESRRKNGRASGFTNESSRLRGRADWQGGCQNQRTRRGHTRKLRKIDKEKESETGRLR